MLNLITVLLYILFVLAAIVLVVVILLQEGRGGGFGAALGTSGQETFGVGTRGINTFTATTAAIFLGSALMIHILNRQRTAGSSLPFQETNGGFESMDTGQGPPPDIQIPPTQPGPGK